MDIKNFEFKALNLPSPIEEIFDECWNSKGIQVFVKRDDLIHPIISGNKWRKLKNYIQTFSLNEHSGILSFGGAYSNHLFALAFAGHALGIPTVGIVRGEELNVTSNPCLRQINEWGMKLHFVTRSLYREKVIPYKYQNYLSIPEGGYGSQAIDGMDTLVNELPSCDAIYCAMGTGATAIGIARATNVPVTGILTLNNQAEIEDHLNDFPTNNLTLDDNYIFGKYAKSNTDLELFCTEFNEKHQIPIEPIYTGRLFYALIDHIKNGHIAPDSKLVAIHTGGIK
jgi:1-aminocyclopropane-1-carboxylate deaminase/D-cysteine desulfhydrase-like pyridoxal-dependent ACC family enzyme